MSENPQSVSDLIGRDRDLQYYDGPDRVVPADDLRAYYDSLPPNPVAFGSGFIDLDNQCSFEGGELVVVGGRPKNGKTSFCQAITANAAKAGINSVWFSYEVPARQFLQQMPREAAFYMPKQLASKDLRWITDRIDEAMLKYNAKAVYIDHLHYLIDMEKIKNPSLEIGAIVRKVKRLAIEKNIVVFLISHVNRGLDRDDEVTEDNLRDSSFTTAEADATIMVSRVKNKAGEATQYCSVRLCNHRRTGAMGLKSYLKRTPAGFVQVERQEVMEYADGGSTVGPGGLLPVRRGKDCGAQLD